jgi:hypothetical protein
MNTLNRPVKLWHGLVGIVLIVLLATGADALATRQKPAASAAAVGKTVLGTTNGYVYRRHTFQADANDVTQGVVDCGRHQVPVGGGGLSVATSPTEFLGSSYPHDSRSHGSTPNGWAVFVVNDSATPQDADVYVICRTVR